MEDTGGVGSKYMTNIGSSGTDNKDGLAQYTIEGVMHFLQTEWAKLEHQRGQWQMDKTELQAQLAFFQGERRGQENLKLDLVRRIKMLEYALKQERAKYQNLKASIDNGSINVSDESGNKDTSSVSVNSVITPSQRLADTNKKTSEYNAKWLQSRQQLKQILDEVVQADRVVDFRQAHVRQMFAQTLGSSGSKNLFDKVVRDDIKGLKEEDNMIKEYSEKLSIDDSGKIDEENFKHEENPQASQPSSASLELGDLINISLHNECESEDNDGAGGYMPVESVLQNDRENTYQAGRDSSGNSDKLIRKCWHTKYVCRGHFDSIRTVEFHPTEAILYTGSCDGTVILWSLNKGGSLYEEGRHVPEPAVMKSNCLDLQPNYVFRGHDGPVLKIVAPHDMNNCPVTTSDSPIAFYSAGIDGTIRSWSVPSDNMKLLDYLDSYKPSLDSGFVYSDGSNAPVYDMVMHPSQQYLISVSANNFLNLWHLTDSANSIKPYKSLDLCKSLENMAKKNVAIGTCTCLCIRSEEVETNSESENLVIVATSNGSIIVVDLDKWAVTNYYQQQSDEKVTNEDKWTSMGIHHLSLHPTLALLVGSCEDKCVRLFDLKKLFEGASDCVDYCIDAHSDAVTCHAIDPTGLYMFTSSNDGTVRLWDLPMKTPIQQYTVHQNKETEGVLSFAMHPTMAFAASAGSDALCHVYCGPDYLSKLDGDRVL